MLALRIKSTQSIGNKSGRAKHKDEKDYHNWRAQAESLSAARRKGGADITSFPECGTPLGSASSVKHKGKAEPNNTDNSKSLAYIVILAFLFGV